MLFSLFCLMVLFCLFYHLKFRKWQFADVFSNLHRVRLNADAHLSATLRCYFRCNWCRNLAAVNCILHWIVLTLSTPHMGITLVIVRSCITLLWLHHNHKISTSDHKNGLVSSHQSVRREFIFYMLCSKNILMKPDGYQQPTCLCVKMEFVVGTISLSCELYSLS